MNTTSFRAKVSLSAAVLLAGLAVSSEAAAITVLTTQTPAESYGDGPYELGMKWQSATDGTITHMRFYRAAGEPADSGEFFVHLGHIWDEAGNLLATVPFAGANGYWNPEGWQTIALFQPLPVEAGKTYVVSVNVVSDYVATAGECAEPIVNGPLSSIADGNNGVFSLTPGAFPTESWYESNYYIDVDVAPASPPEEASVMTSQVPEESYSDGPYELGMKLTSAYPGTITHMRFYRAAGEPADSGEFYVHLGHIWDEAGNLLATVPFAGANGYWNPEGWQEVALFQPLAIDADTTYVVSVNVVSHYVATSEEMANPIGTWPLMSIADGNNGVFNTTPGQFPTDSWFNSNYYVDVTVAY